MGGYVCCSLLIGDDLVVVYCVTNCVLVIVCCLLPVCDCLWFIL